jgi:4-carboxymuconolactone decarboxylase
MTFQDLHAQGETTFAALVPGGAQRLAEIFRVAPDLAEMAVGTVYGHLHSRPALDPRTREAVALAAILAAGTDGTPLAVHLRTGLAAGLAPGEIVEILLETAAFGGFPRAVSALPQVERSLSEAGGTVPPDTTPRAAVLDWLRAPIDPHPALRSLLETWPLPAVHTTAADQALAVFADSDPAVPPRAVVHFRVRQGQVAEVTVLAAAAPEATVDDGR